MTSILKRSCYVGKQIATAKYGGPRQQRSRLNSPPDAPSKADINSSLDFSGSNGHHRSTLSDGSSLNGHTLHGNHALPTDNAYTLLGKTAKPAVTDSDSQNAEVLYTLF